MPFGRGRRKERVLETRVLVTGAGGFIGSHLAEQLVLDGYRVRASVHYNAAGSWHNLEKLPANVLDCIDVMAGDIADPFFVDHAVEGCEVVFHLAALIGIPHEKWGEVGLMVVVLEEDQRATAEDLKAFCSEHLARFKVPKEIVFADGLPYSSYGKVLKVELKKQYGG